jgi:hypothetical protein
MKLKDACKSVNINVDISTIGNESLITRARNYFVSLTLANKSYTHLLFVDADITFDPLSVIRMIQSEKMITAGAYPKKHIDWNRASELYKNEKDFRRTQAIGNLFTKMPLNVGKTLKILRSSGSKHHDVLVRRFCIPAKIRRHHYRWKP